MLNVKFITLGTLKEGYLREAAAEYEKRLGGFCRFEMVQLKEERISDQPSESEIKSALDKESAKIFAEIPSRAYVVAMCVEGKQCSSEELAEKLDDNSSFRSALRESPPSHSSTGYPRERVSHESAADGCG